MVIDWDIPLKQGLMKGSNECKKRKIKCLRKEESPSCERCTLVGSECVLAPNQSYASLLIRTDEASHLDHNLPNNANLDHQARFAALDRKLNLLVRRVDELQTEVRNSRSEESTQQHDIPENSRSNHESGDHLRQDSPPVQPQFVGATRSAFDLNVARSSMNNMGLPTDFPTGSATDDPVATLRKENLELFSLFKPLRQLGKEKVLRLISVFEGELHPAHPYLNIADIVSLVHRFFERYGGEELTGTQDVSNDERAAGQLEFMVVTTVIACAQAVDSLGATVLSKQLVKSAQRYLFDDVGTGRATVEEIVISTTLVCLLYSTHENIILIPHPEHLLLSHRRGPVSLEVSRICNSYGIGDGTSPQGDVDLPVP
jgi:hypothetical protein